MPVDFLTTEQELNYGRYVAEPNDVQLARYFHLDERDLAFINQRRGRHNRLGIALQLTTARFLGTFLTDLTRVLPGVQQFVAVQLNIRRPEVLTRYAERVTTLREHTALIKEYYGYHEFGDFPWSFRLKRLLYTRAWLSNERPGLMFDFATAWLLQNKVLLPGATTLVRLVSEIRERANQRLWKKLAALPDSWQTARVTELLDIPEGQRTSPLEQLKKGPVTVSGPAFTEALERYIRLRNLEFSRLNFTGLPAIQLRNLARYAGMASVKYIARMPQQRKLAVLTAFVKAQETAALDEAVDVLDMLILDITRAAKKTGQKKRLRTLKDLDRAALILARACSLLLDEQADDAELRETIFNSIPKSRLAESVSKVNELARPQNNNFHDEMVEQYGRVKRFLPAVLRDLHFQAAPAGEHTLSAIHYLTELNGSKKRILDNAPEHIITGPWKRLVYDAEGRIQRAGYSLYLLERLQDALRRRDIWLENSDRWGNPREKLLQGEEWQAQRVPVCRALGHPTDGHKGVQQLAVQKVSAVIAIDNDFKKNLIRGENAGIDVHLSGGYMAVAADLRTAVTNAINATTDVNRLTSKATNNIIPLPLYNPTLGYESFIMPLVFIIILQQTLIFTSSMLIALRNSIGLTKINSSQFIGTFFGLFMVGFFGAVFVFGWVYYLQGYPNEGSMFLQVLLIVLFSAAVSSMGMLIGSFLDNINRPMQILSATSMVIFYASGASFPTFNMPEWVVKTMVIFPSSTMISGFTMLNSQGAGIYELAPVIIKISLLAIILFLLAMYRLVWQK